MVWLLVRFNDSYDAAWSVSDMSSTWSHQLTMSTHTCSMVVSHSDSVDRLLQRLLDASHADTTRYHVTDSTMTTSSNDDERHYDVTPVESAAWLEEYWSHTWTTLITLDLLLIAARATVTYVNAVEIYRGGRRTPHQSLTYDQPAMSATDNHCIANGQAGSAACPRLNMKTVDRTARQSTWSTLVDAVSSRSLLTVVYLCWLSSTSAHSSHCSTSQHALLRHQQPSTSSLTSSMTYTRWEFEHIGPCLTQWSENRPDSPRPLWCSQLNSSTYSRCVSSTSIFDLVNRCFYRSFCVITLTSPFFGAFSRTLPTVCYVL